MRKGSGAKRRKGRGPEKCGTWAKGERRGLAPRGVSGRRAVQPGRWDRSSKSKEQEEVGPGKQEGGWGESAKSPPAAGPTAARR